MAQIRDEFEREEIHRERAELGAEHAPTHERDALLRIRGEGREDGSDGRVDAGIQHAADDVSRGGVNHLRVVAQFRREIREHAEGRERDAQPQKPRAMFSEAAADSIKDDAPHRRVHGVHPTRHQQDRRRGARSKAVNVRKKFRDVAADDELENQLAAKIGGRITEALRIGRFAFGGSHEVNRPARSCWARTSLIFTGRPEAQDCSIACITATVTRPSRVSGCGVSPAVRQRAKYSM